METQMVMHGQVVMEIKDITGKKWRDVLPQEIIPFIESKSLKLTDGTGPSVPDESSGSLNVWTCKTYGLDDLIPQKSEIQIGAVIHRGAYQTPLYMYDKGFAGVCQTTLLFIDEPSYVNQVLQSRMGAGGWSFVAPDPSYLGKTASTGFARLVEHGMEEMGIVYSPSKLRLVENLKKAADGVGLKIHLTVADPEELKKIFKSNWPHTEIGKFGGDVCELLEEKDCEKFLLWLAKKNTTPVRA